MVPEFLFIAAGLVVVLAAFAVLRQDKSAFASNLRARIEALQVHCDQRDAFLRNSAKFQARYLFLKQSCLDLTQKETQLKEDISALEPRAAEVETKLVSLTEQKAELQAQLNTLEEDRRKWEDRIKELDRLDELVGESINKRQELGQEIEDTKEKIEQLSDQLKEAQDAENKLIDLKQQVTEIEKEKTAFEQELEVLRTEKSEIETSVEKSKAELEELEKNKSTVEELFKKLESSISVDVAEAISSNNEKKLSHETFSSLFEPEFISSSELHAESPDKWLEDFSKELNENGYDFPKRLIEAFHTSLKVQDVSCLTVMAGISGTGKSALPRLYADYMGMHFLLVPVEPRWDSPQDLFGFLNYMENRYEATPLGRSLNQFNQRDTSSKQPMHDEVLLVLLDEMNLARVEYYFSEFLSRLEARRDADWFNDDEAYQKVSMEIFAGEEDEDGNRINPIRLFAGGNVLFVGTMNEDESTQSLTDKVIDRSNAIHFGRPKSLCARPTGAIKSQEQKTSFEAWSEAIKPELSNMEVSKLVDDYLTRLNETFDRVGRPFGHRAFAATCAYIANHPKALSNDIAELTPLADQIAMRFLPKLRGLDLNEYDQEFDAIRLLLADLKDEAVLQAFDTAANREKGYFQWRGIDWEL